MFVATSVDGFLARRTGALDGLWLTGRGSGGYVELLATVGATLLGRPPLETVVTRDTWPYEMKPVIRSPALPIGSWHDSRRRVTNASIPGLEDPTGRLGDGTGPALCPHPRARSPR